MQKNKEALQKELLQLLEAREKRLKYNLIETYFQETGECRRELYSKHLDFFKAGAKYRERAFIAANRTGKTLAGGYEMSLHLTGRYPDWWEGRRFDHAITAWAIGKTSQTTRDVLQWVLMGTTGDYGTGLIPKDLIINHTSSPGIPGALQDVYVRHVSGNISTLTFKSYVQEVDSFMGTARDVIWQDEECPKHNIYTECLTRTMQTRDRQGGMIYTTFTPLTGLSDVIMSFLPGGKFPVDGIVLDQEGNPGSKYVTNCDWDDVPHLNDESKKELLASYSEIERDARTRGIPSIGSGAVYPVIWEDVIVEPFRIFPWWERAFALDFGWEVTAVLWGVRDPDTGLTYIYSEHYVGKQAVPIHADAIKQRGEWIMGACDPSKGGRNSDGSLWIDEYDRNGVMLVPANNAILPGINKVLTALQSGQLKIFSSCKHLLDEIRTYKYGEDFTPAKRQRDHACDALRYLIMSGMDLARSCPELEDTQHYSPSRLPGYNTVTGY